MKNLKIYFADHLHRCTSLSTDSIVAPSGTHTRTRGSTYRDFAVLAAIYRDSLTLPRFPRSALVFSPFLLQSSPRCSCGKSCSTVTVKIYITWHSECYGFW